ncbi:MAG: ribbon-helix-helix domain-containing protein [Dehalococcoidia bacterium]|jgi:hypothetical protein
MQVSVSVGLQIKTVERLKVISERLHVSRNKLMNEGIEMVLQKYEGEED